MIDAKQITKVFTSGTVETRVLKGIDFTVQDGEFVSIIGPSGSGKSTFLYQLGLLDHPTSGTVYINGQDTAAMNSNERTRLRLFSFGFVFQNYAILPELTALENVILPGLMQGMPRNEAVAEAEAMLERVGLADHLHKRPSQLSGGQQQRVSIARAAARRPSFLFADEPTANLDSHFSHEIIEVFEMLHKEGQTIIMVTHEMEYAERTGRIVELHDGIISSDKKL